MKRSILFTVVLALLFMGFGSLAFPQICVDDWTVTHSGTTDRFLTVEHNWPIVVAISVTGKVWYSEDAGFTWDPDYADDISGNINDVVRSDLNSVWVAVGRDGLISKGSADGTTWTNQSQVTLNSLYTVAYDSYSEIFIAGGDAGTIVTSTNGVNWNVYNAGVSRVTAIAFNGLGRAACVNTIGQIRTSDNNGQTWTLRSTLSNMQLKSMAYGNGVWVVGGRDNLNGGVTTIWKSTDCINWTQQTIPASTGYVHDITYTGTDFVAAANKQVLVSSNGINWTLEYTAPSVIYGIRAGMDTVVGVGPLGQIITSDCN